MSRYIECDGCGRKEIDHGRAGSNVQVASFTVGTLTKWSVDLCPQCVKRITNPKEWPKGKPE